MSELTLTMGRDKHGRLLAIITTGGHPQINLDEPCTVLTLDVVANKVEGRRWFERMKLERPWDTRQ